MNNARGTGMHEIVLPRLHGNASQCRVLAWLKEVGDAVRPGDSLLVLETDKATVELEAEVPGVLASIMHAAGDWVEISTTVGTIESEPQPNERYE